VTWNEYLGWLEKDMLIRLAFLVFVILPVAAVMAWRMRRRG
jgi:hypothetical protein